MCNNPSKCKRREVLDSWLKARDNLLGCQYKVLLPAVKLTEKKTNAPWEYTNCSGIIIKMNDLVSSNGHGTSSIYDAISKKGGLHSYLNFSGPIILSTIMEDEVIRGLKAELYAHIINEIEPNFYLTPDGQNYVNRPQAVSSEEIKRMLIETGYLLKAGLKAKPLGLIKGCSRLEAEEHCKKLLDFGITHHVLHVGDYLSRGKAVERDAILSIYRKVVVTSPWLILYGVGSKRNFHTFNRCNGYATQSHYAYKFVKNEKKIQSNHVKENLMKIEAILLDSETKQVKKGQQSQIEKWC